MNQFPSKERDAETGLDFFGARYYSGAQGRFLSSDPLGGKSHNPQSSNRYTYVLNNPLKYTDPTGLHECEGTECDRFEETLVLQRKSKDKKVQRAAAAYGRKGDKNGVHVVVSDLSKAMKGGETVSVIGGDGDGHYRAESYVTIDPNVTGAAFDASIAQEGSHAADAQEVVNSGLLEIDGKIYANKNITPYASEQTGYAVSDSVLKSGNSKIPYACGGNSCVLGLGVLPATVPEIVDKILSSNSIYNIGGRPMSEQNQGTSVVQDVVGQVPKATVPR